MALLDHHPDHAAHPHWRLRNGLRHEGGLQGLALETRPMLGLGPIPNVIFATTTTP